METFIIKPGHRKREQAPKWDTHAPTEAAAAALLFNALWAQRV